MAEHNDTSPSAGTVRLQLYKSPIGYNARQRATVQALGLRRLHQVVVQADSAVTRGMVAKVPHLVRVVAVQERPSLDAHAAPAGHGELGPSRHEPGTDAADQSVRGMSTHETA